MTAVYRPEDVTEVYWHTFAGDLTRHGVWATDHWTSVHEPPTHEALASALSGSGPVISAPMLADGDQTHVGAVDVDHDEWSIPLAIARAFLAAGVICYVSHSRRGGHIRFVLDEVMPAILVRDALRAAIQRAGYDPSDPKIELRPSTHRKSSPFAGHMLRMPYMPHHLTGERYPLLDSLTEQPIADKASTALLVLEWADADALVGLAERYVPPAPVGVIKPAPRRGGDEETVSAVLARLFGATVAPGGQLKCVLHADEHASANIARNDLRYWCHAPACEGYENGRGITAWKLAQLGPVAS